MWLSVNYSALGQDTGQLYARLRSPGGAEAGEERVGYTGWGDA